MGSFIIGIFDGVLNKVRAVIAFAKKAKSFVFGGDDEGADERQSAIENGQAFDIPSTLPPRQVIAPSERVSKSIEETREVSSNTLTIKDETGRGELTSTGSQPPAFINLISSGVF